MCAFPAQRENIASKSDEGLTSAMTKRIETSRGSQGSAASIAFNQTGAR